MKIIKKFNVVINMVVGNVHYHEFQLEGFENEYEIFESIKNKDWLHYERTTKSIVNNVQLTKVYKEFIQVKHISDVSVVEI